MGLIEHSKDVHAFTGGFGGTYFGADSSGQHIRAKPRTTQRTPAENLRLQRNWYMEKKYFEKYGLPENFPLIEDVPPGGYFVYSLETLFGDRWPSFSKPQQMNVEYTGFYPDAIRQWINNNWNPIWANWGLTKDIMFLLMCKWFYMYKYVKGFSSDVALAAAKVMMKNWISVAAAATAVPLLSLWAGLVGLGLFFGFLSWLEGCGGYIRFNVGRIIIRKDTSLWWGGLIGRMSPKMYDFGVCSKTTFDSALHHTAPGPGTYKTHWFDMSELWQTVDLGIIYNYIYQWSEVRCTFRGMAHRVGDRHIRMKVNPSQHAFWNKPIGWYTTLEQACAYTGQFTEYFRCRGDPGPPL